MRLTPADLTYEDFCTLVTRLLELKTQAQAYLEPLPTELVSALTDNAYAKAHWEMLTLVSVSAFGEAWPDVEWFLHEWRPGLNIMVDYPDGTKEYTIHSLEDYLAYAKMELY